MYNMKKNIRDFFREILELLFQAAALVIDTIRTFFLVVLAILGPIAFAISVWDGFQSTLTQWICRYIQVYLWLPVSDMFSTILAKIQVLMLQSDIERMQADPVSYTHLYRFGSRQRLPYTVGDVEQRAQSGDAFRHACHVLAQRQMCIRDSF